MSMPSVLEAIVGRTRARLAESPPDLRRLEAMALEAPAPRDVWAALDREGSKAATRNAIIAEVKRRSPSLGALSAEADAVTVATTYEGAGAAAISVLTEPERFGGRFEDLDAVSRRVAIPTLCKDFIVDPRQVLMARAHGASLALLIVAALDDEALVSLQRDIEALGMVALVEVHDEAELERALRCEAKVIGVNNRSLHTLHIDLAVSERLRPMIPDDRLPIAESGVSTPEDILRLRASGYHRFLIGSSLMTSPDPGALLRSLVTASEPSSPALRAAP